MIRLIATDVDGTLVKDGAGSINPEYYEVISRLCDKGITFCIASGRQFASVQKLFAPVADKLFYIAEGGAILRDSKQVHHLETIPLELISEFLDDCRSCPDTDHLAATPDLTYSENGETTLMYRMLKDSYGFDMKNLESLNQAPLEQVVKISIFHETNAEQICSQTLIPKWKDKLQLVCSGNQWIDTLSSKTSKGNALNRLQKQLGISPEETMVFGDNMNDISMLKQAKYSYAVANAREELKKEAAFIADSYKNDGVLQKLKKLL